MRLFPEPRNIIIMHSMDWLIVVIGLTVGVLLGGAVAAAVCLARRHAIQTELANARTRAELLEQQSRELTGEIDRVRGESSQIDRSREAAERQAAVLRQEVQHKQQQFEEHQRLLQDAEKKLTDTFKSVGADALRNNNQQFIDLARQTFEKLMKEASGDVEKKQQAIDAIVKPIKELLEKQNTAVGEIEKKREVAYKGLEEQIKAIAQSHDGLRNETGKLVSALRRPEQRGKWGEMQLRNAVELAGMSAHCDYEEQVTIWNGDVTQRPDMVVNLPRRGVIPVDAKVAIDAYLDAVQCADGEAKTACLKRHADQVEKHWKQLANRRYWEGFQESHAPQLVVMFMPLESALVAALDVKPDLHSAAMQQHVLIATPTLLVALLRAAAYGWQQDALAQNAQEIAKTGAELYSRIQKFVGDLDRVGRNLDQASRAYNTAIGSLEARVLPGVRKIKELHATTDPEIETPAPVDIEIRPIVAQELKPQPQLFNNAG